MLKSCFIYPYYRMNSYCNKGDSGACIEQQPIAYRIGAYIQIEEARTMAIVSQVVSDITGTVATNGDAIEVVVRHPKFGDKKIDAIAGELDALKTLDNLVEVEVRYKSGNTSELMCTVAELAKVVPDAVLEAAQGTKGRRRGYSPQ